ncbi:ATP:cob(I)alamin adenosyltransferase [Flavipsychrobacter stenotrophus]|uniref:Corrinoid adenosyltransferase n=1 Tax=Flavipsychrobacter stenotrophus TaxID=2077091 RepID=A0A2S7SYS1_9BACT|nr:cob(I)yrinic acid a,c-diamide adenosyltransferase [Flavipsychrobacter stenotrophus]PQJ11864.1 ATP:cob(I)alamin adenosyltransferase [Flavipsychrobacter stenotrophus]
MFKIYTKTGDKGGTSLIGGVRVPKSHIRIESYGTVDELNSYIGMVSDMVNNEAIIEELREIQDRLFTVGSALATNPDKEVKMKLPDLHDTDITWLEERIDKMNEVLPEMRSFILPGGNLASSTCHVARCVCRRAERICVAMQEEGEFMPQQILSYLNRLSDYLFVLSRYISHINNAAEMPWRARM